MTVETGYPRQASRDRQNRRERTAGTGKHGQVSLDRKDETEHTGPDMTSNVVLYVFKYY
jgi:hypothetical protein